MHNPSFLWHDYETTGIDPQRDRIYQFAGIRTNEDLEVMGDPQMFYCQPANDSLPHPEAVLVTGISPQEAQTKGLNEADFARAVHAIMSTSNTCNVGYNTLRFDDNMTRQLLYRNFYDPYAREWQNGNSRWDLIDLARMCYALRPDGIVWPKRQDGAPSFKLEDLARANQLEQRHAHDALSDVEATIALARLIKAEQPKLWQWYFELRKKTAVWKLIKQSGSSPLVHISSRYPSNDGCLRLIRPLCPHPEHSNELIIADLSVNPETWVNLSANDISERMFTPQKDMPEDVSRPGLRTIHVNRSPALAPLSVLKGIDRARIHLDVDTCLAHDKILASIDDIKVKVQAVYTKAGNYPEPEDAELGLYAGFPSKHDKAEFERIRHTNSTELASLDPCFHDARYQDLFLRYRARNWPQTLNHEEHTIWQAFRRARLTQSTPVTSLTLDTYHVTIRQLRTTNQGDGQKQVLLDQLEAWGIKLQESLV